MLYELYTENKNKKGDYEYLKLRQLSIEDTLVYFKKPSV
jgi:hypothetical protein